MKNKKTLEEQLIDRLLPHVTGNVESAAIEVLNWLTEHFTEVHPELREEDEFYGRIYGTGDRLVSCDRIDEIIHSLGILRYCRTGPEPITEVFDGDDSFTYKGYGRIYVRGEHVSLVEAWIKAQSEFEWSYYPEGLVTLATEYPRSIYVGKFEPDLADLKQKCKDSRVPIFVLNAGTDDCNPAYLLKRVDFLKLFPQSDPID